MLHWELLFVNTDRQKDQGKYVYYIKSVRSVHFIRVVKFNMSHTTMFLSPKSGFQNLIVDHASVVLSYTHQGEINMGVDFWRKERGKKFLNMMYGHETVPPIRKLIVCGLPTILLAILRQTRMARYTFG